MATINSAGQARIARVRNVGTNRARQRRGGLECAHWCVIISGKAEDQMHFFYVPKAFELENLNAIFRPIYLIEKTKTHHYFIFYILYNTLRYNIERKVFPCNFFRVSRRRY